jgi:membrane fusion protein (multidrug efflux system)
MLQPRHWLAVLWGLLLTTPLAAQTKPSESGKVVTAAPSAEATIPEHVVIKREALQLIHPDVYRVSLQLRPTRDVFLTAPTDGIIRSVSLQPGDRAEAQAEAIRLDNREDELLLEEAKARFKVAQLEEQRAKGQGDAELAAAKLAAAKAALEVAQFRVDRNSIRVPFAGQMYRVNVVPGQFVRAGEPLARFGDPKQLQVEIPVDRKQTGAGETLNIRVEEQSVTAQVEKVLPLAAEFEPLRDLINSAASAIVVVDNADGRFSVGQAVFAPLVPQQPVVQTPTAALINTPEGGRKLQVLRDGVVRDVSLQLHGQVGVDRIYVSGPFAAGDEVILSTSAELPDGTQVRLSGPPPAAATQASSRTPGAAPTRSSPDAPRQKF